MPIPYNLTNTKKIEKIFSVKNYCMSTKKYFIWKNISKSSLLKLNYLKKENQ